MAVGVGLGLNARRRLESRTAFTARAATLAGAGLVYLLSISETMGYRRPFGAVVEWMALRAQSVADACSSYL
jgi:hypothetical protein